VTGWKFYRTDCLDILVIIKDRLKLDLAKAAVLCDYRRDQILDLEFDTRDQFHGRTIRSRVKHHDGPQLREYIRGAKVQKLIKDRNLKLQAYLVIIVGSRRVLLWEMDKQGNLAADPRFIGMPHHR
jgi:hypothetical protein